MEKVNYFILLILILMLCVYVSQCEKSEVEDTSKTIHAADAIEIDPIFCADYEDDDEFDASSDVDIDGQNNGLCLFEQAACVNGKLPEWCDSIEIGETMIADEARVLFVRTKPSIVMDSFLNNVEKTDVRKIYPNDYFYDLKAYYLSVSTNAIDAKSPFWGYFLNFKPDKVNIEGAKYITITINERSEICPDAKYCFAYGNLLIYTSQWIDGFFDRVEMPIKMHLGTDLYVTEFFYYWKCVYSGGKFDYQFFVFNDEKMNEFGYELTKKEYHKVVRKSADD